MKQTHSPIHEAVRQRYASHARSTSPCCDSGNTFYPEELLKVLPTDIAGYSLGCGNPITLAALKQGETVLDLGSGGGLDCFLAARQVGEKGLVIGVDMTPEMLERARLSASRLGITNVEFRLGYLEELPVEDNTVDAVISNCVINLSPDKSKVFHEMYRILKPGGRVAVSDIVTNGPLPESMQKDMEAWGACVAGALDVSEYSNGLRQAGFSDITVLPKDDFGHEPTCDPDSKVFSATVTGRKT